MKNIFAGAVVMLLVGVGCAQQRIATKPQTTEPKSVHEKVYFEFGQASVRAEDEDVLARIASQLKSHEKTVTVLEGHSDPIGEARYNEILAEERARSVRVYLRDQGVEPHQITVTSKGEREPVVTGYGRRSLQPNRRVDIRFLLTGRNDETSR